MVSALRRLSDKVFLAANRVFVVPQAGQIRSGMVRIFPGESKAFLAESIVAGWVASRQPREYA